MPARWNPNPVFICPRMQWSEWWRSIQWLLICRLWMGYSAGALSYLSMILTLRVQGFTSDRLMFHSYHYSAKAKGSIRWLGFAELCSSKPYAESLILNHSYQKCMFLFIPIHNRTLKAGLLRSVGRLFQYWERYDSHTIISNYEYVCRASELWSPRI